MAAADHQIAGRAEVLQASIKSGSTQIDIQPQLLNVSIFEDIYTPFVYVELTIADYDEIARKLPLIGEEFFVFSFRSNLGKMVSYQFLLYKNDTGGSNATNTMQAYVLRGVTLEKAFDTAKTVNASYKGTYAQIAGQIFDDYLGRDAGGYSLQYEPTKSVQRFISPFLSPLECIEWCRNRAVSADSAAKSPFVFFRNSEGYYFISLNGLFNKSAGEDLAKLAHVYYGKSTPPDQVDRVDDGGNAYKADIVSYDIQTKYDTMSKQRDGAYNTHSYTFDLTTKQFVFRKPFNASQDANKFQLGNPGEFNRPDFLGLFNDSRCYNYYQPVNFSVELEGTTTNFLPDHVGEMRAYAGLVSEYNAKFRMYGDSNITAGKVLKVSIPQSTGDKQAERSEDPMVTGYMLCASVRHDITIADRVTYFLSISGIKGSFPTSIEELNK